MFAITILGACLEVFQGEVYRESCSRFLLGCPDEHFWRYEVYKCKKNVFYFEFDVRDHALDSIIISLIFLLDPACQFISVAHKCYILDPSCVSGETRKTDCKNNSTNENISCSKETPTVFLPSVLGVLLPIAIIGFIVLVFFLWGKWKPKQGL